MAFHCSTCSTKMRVVRVSTTDNITQRWYLCLQCSETARTREALYTPDPPKHRKGAEHPHAVLNADNVRDLRARRAAGATLSELSAHFGIARSTVCDIANNRAWVHVS